MTGPWESDVVLADGGTVHLRPIRAADDDALLGLYHRLSDDSRYLRFFSPVSPPTAAQLESLTRCDGERRFALVAELGDDLVAVARYDRAPDSDEAEVAFTVQDDQHGRGLGTILLEHLAVVGRARGIERFVASTLPHNRRMLDVFRSAGFDVDRAFADGVVHVSFSIEPTEASAAAAEAREHVSEAASVARLMAPRSIAVVGAGRRPGSIGHELFRNLMRAGFTGAVYPVNPYATAVASVRAYPSVADVPDAIDLAVIAVPSTAVLAVVRDCAAKAVRGLIVISAGFSEVGTDRAASAGELVRLARRGGMRLVGPAAMGVVNTNPHVSMQATFASVVPPRGRVGFSSQSGALGAELMAEAAALGLGISTFVSVGDKADVSGNDLLQYWEDDPDTDVILLYLENFGNPRKFARLARRIGRHKPIVAVKSGRSTTDRAVTTSHTAVLASSDVAVDALFHQAGVIRVDTLEQFFDTAQLLAHQPLPCGRRVAIVSNGRGPAMLAADACAGAGLELAVLSSRARSDLDDVLSPDASGTNPLDLVVSATAEQYERAVRAVLADPAVDAVLAIFAPPLVTTADDVARAIVAAASSADDKPLATCFLGCRGVPEALRPPEARRAIPSFSFPEAAAFALGRVAAHAAWRRRPVGREPELARIDVDGARVLVAARMEVRPDGGWLDPAEAVRLAACFGIDAVATHWVASASGAVDAAKDLGFPVALKAGSAALVHKTDVGGVRLGLGAPDEVREAFASMREALGDGMGGAVVQPMVAPGVETIVGVTHDPSFGPLVLFGMGGLTAELVRDTALRILPLTDLDARELVGSLRSSPLLFGYRGRPPCDVAALEDLLVRVGRLADAIPEIVELDCNPVIVSPAGAVVVDVKVRLGPAIVGAPDLRRLRTA